MAGCRAKFNFISLPVQGKHQLHFLQSKVLIALIHALDIGRAMLAGLKILMLSGIWDLRINFGAVSTPRNTYNGTEK